METMRKRSTWAARSPCVEERRAGAIRKSGKVGTLYSHRELTVEPINEALKGFEKLPPSRTLANMDPFLDLKVQSLKNQAELIAQLRTAQLAVGAQGGQKWPANGYKWEGVCEVLKEVTDKAGLTDPASSKLTDFKKIELLEIGKGRSLLSTWDAATKLTKSAVDQAVAATQKRKLEGVVDLNIGDVMIFREVTSDGGRERVPLVWQVGCRTGSR